MRGAAAAILALALAGCATGADVDPPPINGLGTEPFWNFTLERGRFSYATPELPRPRSVAITPRMAADGTITAEASFAGRPMRLRIAPGACSDGMSDRPYPMTAELTIEDRALSGCAYRADSPPPPQQP